MTKFGHIADLEGVSFSNLKHNVTMLRINSLIPRPSHSFCRLQYEKHGRPGIFYHVSDVEGRERVERL